MDFRHYRHSAMNHKIGGEYFIFFIQMEFSFFFFDFLFYRTTNQKYRSPVHIYPKESRYTHNIHPTKIHDLFNLLEFLLPFSFDSFRADINLMKIKFIFFGYSIIFYMHCIPTYNRNRLQRYENTENFLFLRKGKFKEKKIEKRKITQKKTKALLLKIKIKLFILKKTKKFSSKFFFSFSLF